MISYDGVITLVTLSLLGLCSLSKDRGVIVYGYILAMYNITSPYIPDSQGLYYYLGAATNDFILLKYLNTRRKTRVISVLRSTSKLFILINLFGWILYEAGYKPLGYFLLSLVTYLYVLYTIIRCGDLDYVGDNRALSWLVRFSSNNNQCNYSIPRSEGQRQ